MLKSELIHPEISQIVAQAGHSSKILIADGNYPATTKRGPKANVVPLQLMPNVPTVADVFEAILGSIQIDAVQTMGVDRDDSYAAATPGDPPVWEKYRNLLKSQPNPSNLCPNRSKIDLEAILEPILN